MRYYLSNNFVLRWLEEKCIYDLKNDELFELDDEAFEFLKGCASLNGCSIEGLAPEFRDFCLNEKILNEKPYKQEIEPLNQSPVPSLRYLELQITDRCNLKCKHCYVGKSKNNELPLNVIQNILQEFFEMQGLRVMITGGEPLLHSDFKGLNEVLQNYALRKVLFTNGILLNARLLKSLHVDEIQFSIDGMKRGHEAIRGKGTFSVVIDNMKGAKRHGFSVSVATIIHSKNLDEFDEMESFFKELGVKDWTVDVPTPVGNLKDNPAFQVPPDIAGKYLNYGFGENYHTTAEGFTCGLHLVSVLANGTIAKCAFYCDTPIGYIDEGLRKVWARLKPIKLEELECYDISCPVINSCRGGCRYRALFLTDKNENKYKKDIYKCHAYGIIKH